MTDGVLVEALRAREPAALSGLYDSYAESVYRYCHSMLGVPAGAELALLDTFAAAEAHVHALADSRRLEAWLYALARGSAYGAVSPGSSTRRSPSRWSPARWTCG